MYYDRKKEIVSSVKKKAKFDNKSTIKINSFAAFELFQLI